MKAKIEQLSKYLQFSIKYIVVVLLALCTAWCVAINISNKYAFNKKNMYNGQFMVALT